MNLRELIEDVDVPDTRVAEGTWERARGRVRRRRLVTSGAAGLAVATVVVAVSLIPGGQRADGPPRLDSPTPSPTAGPAELVVTVPDWEALVVDRVPTPGPDADPLSENPVDRASLVMADPDDDAGAYVLGDDGDWRRLDVEGLRPVSDGTYSSPLVRPTGLDETGTKLAIPQPDGLVVVDLTTGAAERYDVPGFHSFAIWHDETHVLVAQENGNFSTVVDLASGTTEPSPDGPSTRVLADGSALTWDDRGPLEWSDGRVVETPVNNAAGLFPSPPLVRDGVVVGLTSKLPERDPAPADPPAVLSETNGVVAVDADTGEPVAFIKLGQTNGEATTLLGWAGDLPVLGLVRSEDNVQQTRVVTWDYRSGELHPLAVLPTWWVSWGVGL
jgi:hypothetical protein